MDTALIGAYGEVVTGRYLRDRGYNIVTANYRTRLGEIDIIAANRRFIVFTEVKTRSSDAVLRAADAVDYAKRKRIIATANSFLSGHETKLQPRFDVAEVYLDGTEVKSFNYIENAYEE